MAHLAHPLMHIDPIGQPWWSSQGKILGRIADDPRSSRASFTHALIARLRQRRGCLESHAHEAGMFCSSHDCRHSCSMFCAEVTAGRSRNEESQCEGKAFRGKAFHKISVDPERALQG